MTIDRGSEHEYRNSDDACAGTGGEGLHATDYGSNKYQNKRHTTRQDDKRRRPSARIIAGCMLLLLSALLATLPFMMMLSSSRAQQAADDAHDRAARELTAKKRRAQWNAAVAYNKRLAVSGQPVLGKIVDPFTTGDGEGTSLAQEYKKQLTLPADGVMSTVRYPRLGISLPVRHGTDQEVLARGAGHLYGTSLPVGGTNTHTVVSAHTGLADKVMFDKLDGLGGRAKKGDIFYLTTLGTDLAYKVVDIRVVDPGDFSKLRIVKGKDLATLLTCTPYGVNTQRLLVTGERVKIPVPAPPVSAAGRDRSWIWWVVGILAVWIVMILAVVRALAAGKSRTSAGHAHGRHIAAVSASSKDAVDTQDRQK